MSENEFRKLSREERAQVPAYVAHAALHYTHEQGRELLLLEGWEFVANGEPEGEAEVWRRVVEGKEEWCDYCQLFPHPQLPDELCWCRQMYPFDPRLIAD